jgi:hypothetical protein
MKKDLEDIGSIDFGFDFIDDEIEEIKQTAADKEVLSDEIIDLKNRLDSLYNAILPFLDNLCKNPDKSTIHWPNRVEKIRDYKNKLKQIVEGD